MKGRIMSRAPVLFSPPLFSLYFFIPAYELTQKLFHSFLSLSLSLLSRNDRRLSIRSIELIQSRDRFLKRRPDPGCD